MKPVSKAWRAFFALVILLCTSWPAFAEENGPTFLVATPELPGSFAGAVLLVTAWEDEHVGIILNKPTGVTMAQLFPGHEPSTRVKAPVYLGGPVHQDSVFALVAAEEAPHPKSIALAPGVWLVLDGSAVDRLMEVDPNAQRYIAGAVTWHPGELAEELRKGMWVVRPFDKARVFLPDTSGLWNELAPAPKKAGEVGT